MPLRCELTTSRSPADSRGARGPQVWSRPASPDYVPHPWQRLMSTVASALLFCSTLSSGLTAGLFFGWAVSVLPGTAKVSDRNYVATMQSINIAIINPIFMLAFLGTAIVLAAGAWCHHRDGQARRGWLLAAAAGTYALGVVGVTAARNVPLNNQLDAFVLDGASDTTVSERRTRYESSWNAWHYVRTIANIAAFCLAITAQSADRPNAGAGHTSLRQI